MGRMLQGFDARVEAAEDRLRELRNRFAAAGFDLFAEGFDRVAYFRDVIEAETALAEVFAAARKSLRAAGVVWSALWEAERRHLDFADDVRRLLSASDTAAADTASALVSR